MIEKNITITIIMGFFDSSSSSSEGGSGSDSGGGEENVGRRVRALDREGVEAHDDAPD